MSKHVHHTLEKEHTKIIICMKGLFHHNLGLFHLELRKWMWIFKGFGHSSYTHQWWVWSLYIEIFCSWVFVGIVWASQKYIAWKCFYISCVFHHGWWINWSNHGTTLDSLLMLFGFSREGLSNDIFYGIVGYQGCHSRKYVCCLVFFIGGTRLGFIKIGSPYY